MREVNNYRSVRRNADGTTTFSVVVEPTTEPTLLLSDLPASTRFAISTASGVSNGEYVAVLFETTGESRLFDAIDALAKLRLINKANRPFTTTPVVFSGVKRFINLYVVNVATEFELTVTVGEVGR